MHAHVLGVRFSALAMRRADFRSFRSDRANSTRPLEQTIDCIGFGLYRCNLPRYFAEFPSQRVKVVFNDDLRRNAQKALGDIFSFLEVDLSAEINTSAELTVSGVPRITVLHWLLGHHNIFKDNLGPLLPEWARDATPKTKNANLQRQSITPAKSGQPSRNTLSRTWSNSETCSQSTPAAGAVERH
jgi:hypothetical protein